MGIGGHTGGSWQGHPRCTSASTEEGRGWSNRHKTTNTMRVETKMHTGTPKIDTGKLANLIEFDKEAHDKIPKEHGTERSN